MFSGPFTSEEVHASLARQHFGGDHHKDWRGIGMMMDQDSLGRKFVKFLFKEGPCSKLGAIQPGDLVHEINGTDVNLLSLKECRQLVADAQRSVLLRLSRPTTPPFSRSRSNSLEAAAASDAETHKDSDDSADEAVHDCSADTVPRGVMTEDGFEVTAARSLAVEDLEEFAVEVPIETVMPSGEDILDTFSYVKGSSSFLSGRRRLSLGSEPRGMERRWIALRDGKLIVTKGEKSKITKVVDVASCEPVHVVAYDKDQGGHCFVAFKHLARPTLYVGDTDPHKVQRLLQLAQAAQAPLVMAHEPTSIEMTTGGGYCAVKVQVCEDQATDYCQLK